MDFKVGDFEISEEQYIEIKQTAYKYYDEYIKLDKKERKSFLENLPKTNNPAEMFIIRNTLLFPDTSILINCTRGELQHILDKVMNNEDNVERQDVMAKSIEYSRFNIKKLVSEEKLTVMDKYGCPDYSISDREYISLKTEALKYVREFQNLSLEEKEKFILNCCSRESYQEKIQTATMLLPNDMELMYQLRGNSTSDVANYYSVPECLIDFKVTEYEKQNTKGLIQEGLLPKNKSYRLWYMSPVEDEVTYVWGPNYREPQLDAEQIGRINESLENSYKQYSKNQTK